ncbi:MAG: cyclase family protein [Acidimicrobiales bacterium]
MKNQASVDRHAPAARSARWGRRGVVAALAATAVVAGAAGAAGARFGFEVRGSGGGGAGAVLRCNGGMTRLSHVLFEGASVFPGDPIPTVEIVNAIDPDGFKLELVTTGTHTGTHLDAPGHFHDGGRTVDQLEAEDLVWPAYVIDVRNRIAADGPDDFQLTVDDVRRVERRQGRIPNGALVIIRTGFDTAFGTPAYDEPAPGFAGETVQWLFDERHIGGVGSDTYGPDATSDEDFSATDTALGNDGIAMPGLNNLGSLNPTGDIVIAGVVPLKDGSGYQIDPLACHSRKR